MDVLICWLSQVPDVIWSAIIASFLTFLGVMWTNKGNERRQIALLNHEKEKYKSEQKLALKKEVFLDAASSFADVLGVIPRLMNLDFSEKEIDEQIANHSGLVAKSYLVAREDSVAEILSYSAETAETFLGLTKDRHILLDHKKAIDIYQAMINSADAEKNRLLSMMKEFNLQGRNDQNTFDYLKQNYDIQENQVEISTKNRSEQQSTLERLHLNFMKKCLAEHSRLLSLLPPMVIALRNELDNDGNSVVFIRALNANISRMNRAFETMFQDAENQQA